MKIIVTAYRNNRVIWKRAYTNSTLPTMAKLYKIVPMADRFTIK